MGLLASWTAFFPTMAERSSRRNVGQPLSSALGHRPEPPCGRLRVGKPAKHLYEREGFEFAGSSDKSGKGLRLEREL